MRIQNNINAMNSLRQLSVNNRATSKSLEKLASGLRINKAGDDAAGLSISEKMRAQVRGLNMAEKNAQDAISLIQTAEGALNETHGILQRMRELSVQAANDTITNDDREEIQKEMDQLGEELDRIADTTQFNTKNLLDGSMGEGVSTNVANINTNTSIAAIDETGTNNLAITTNLTDLTDSAGANLGISAGDKIEVSYIVNGKNVSSTFEVVAADKDEGQVATLEDILTGAGTNETETYFTGVVENGDINITAEEKGFGGGVNGLTFTVSNSEGKVKASASNALSSFSETKAAADVRVDGQATFQIGANTGQNIKLSIEDMSSAALGVEKLKVGNQGQANVAMKVLDGAVQKVSAERSKLGATQNRLEHTINNLETSAENLTAAESRIRDVDMAAEMVEFTKNNILSQVAQSMLAQAQQQPQSVLGLLQ